jgi:hypothetical protein
MNPNMRTKTLEDLLEFFTAMPEKESAEGGDMGQSADGLPAQDAQGIEMTKLAVTKDPKAMMGM